MEQPVDERLIIGDSYLKELRKRVDLKGNGRTVHQCKGKTAVLDAILIHANLLYKGKDLSGARERLDKFYEVAAELEQLLRS